MTLELPSPDFMTRAILYGAMITIAVCMAWELYRRRPKGRKSTTIIRLNPDQTRIIGEAIDSRDKAIHDISAEVTAKLTAALGPVQADFWTTVYAHVPGTSPDVTCLVKRDGKTGEIVIVVDPTTTPKTRVGKLPAESTT